MSSKFLNDRLVTTPRFAPGEHAKQVPSPIPAEPESSASEVPRHASADDYVRIEERKMRDDVLRDEARELRRRRSELMRRLDVMLADLEREQAARAACLTRFARERAALEALGDLSEDDVDATVLRKHKASIHAVHIETMSYERARVAGQNAASPPPPALLSLSLGQLARLGFGLGWPLALALLLAAALVVLGLFLVMGY